MIILFPNNLGRTIEIKRPGFCMVQQHISLNFDIFFKFNGDDTNIFWLYILYIQIQIQTIFIAS